MDKILAWLESRTDIKSLRAAVCDLNGVMRGKRIPLEQAEKVLSGGLRMPLSVVGVDIWGEDIVKSPLVFATGDADGTCEFDRARHPAGGLDGRTVGPHPPLATRGKRSAFRR